MKWILTAFSCLTIFASIAQSYDQAHLCYMKDPKAKYREHNVDMLKMILDVRFEVKEGKVIGDVTYIFSPIQLKVDTLYLDGPGVKVSAASLDGEAIEFKSNDKGITFYFNSTLTWDSEHTLNIKYEAYPRKGIYFIGWNDEKNISRKQIWTQGQGVDNRYWIPSYDNQNDKLITETVVTFDEEYRVISNGNLIEEKENNDGTKTWHHQMTKPHALYLVMLGIGNYDYKDMTSKGGKVSRQYYYPDKPETFESTYEYSAEMMDWCEEEYGVEYPWETYCNVPVQDFIYGAMENTTATIFTDYYVQDERGALERNYVGTNAHELVHQWWGDYVTAWSGTHHWLHESFATHYAKQFRRSVYGEDWYDWSRRQEMKRAWSANLKDQIPIAHSQAGGSRHYPKGSIVLDMFRYVLGDVQYKRAITHFLKSHPYDMVDTHDFYVAFMESLGVNLDWFFDQWLYRGGEPHYVVNYEKEKKETIVYINQATETSTLVSYFKMPIVTQVHYENGEMDELRQWIEGPQDTVVIPKVNGKKVAFVLFDPNYQVLKTIEFDREFEELVAQAKNAPHMIDKFDAVEAMGEIDIDTKRDALIDLYNDKNYHPIQASIIKQLVNDDNEKSQAVIKLALKDEVPEVRRAVIDNVSKIDGDMIAEYEVLLTDRSYVTIEKALRKLCKDNKSETEKYLDITKNEEGMNKNIRIAWLKIACEDDAAKHIDELVSYTTHSYEFRTREKAIDVVGDLDYYDDNVVKSLTHGMFYFNRRVSRKAIKVAGNLMDDHKECKKMFEDYYKANEWKDWEDEILRKHIMNDED